MKAMTNASIAFWLFGSLAYLSAFGLPEPTEPASIRVVGTSTTPSFEVDQLYHRDGPLPGVELPSAAILRQQEVQASLQGIFNTPMNAQNWDDKQLNPLDPIVNNLHATSALIGQVMEDREITEIRRQHYERAERLVLLIIRPFREPISYHLLRKFDPYLIGSLARILIWRYKPCFLSLSTIGHQVSELSWFCSASRSRSKGEKYDGPEPTPD